MFGPDATVASQILNIALTSREAGKGKESPCAVCLIIPRKIILAN